MGALRLGISKYVQKDFCGFGFETWQGRKDIVAWW
jgi:hypothetical protein